MRFEDQYYAGSGKFVKSNIYTQEWNLPRKDRQTIPELAVIKL
ncbi:MAG: hypothetical protein SGI83_05670 [Bacteroidota bacterium]|nr:hypothetical protein [Bacteroidota bacterium]